MGNIFLQLQDSLPMLPSGEKRVADFVLAHTPDIITLPIDKVAAACRTSPATVIRLCKRLGVTGYRDFTRQIASEISVAPNVNNEYQDIAPGDTLMEIAQKVSTTNLLAIENTLQLLDEKELERAVTAITNAHRVDFYGVGTSGLAALDAHNKFLRIGKFSYATIDPHQQILSTYSLAPGDVALFISYSGETSDTLESAQIAKDAGATIISLTRSCRNSLSNLADITLYSYNAESLIRSGPKGSRIAQLTIIDILYTCVISNNFVDVRRHLDNTRFLGDHKTRRPQE